LCRRHGGLWHAHGNENEDVGEGDNTVDWQDSDDDEGDCHVLDHGVEGRGLRGRDDASMQL